MKIMQHIKCTYWKKSKRKLQAKISCMALVIKMCLLLPGHILAQDRVFVDPSPVASTVISVKARNLDVCCNKTCMLIFPAAIQSADRGAAYVLASRVPGSENVLKVKAARPGFDTSSLTVITKDGKVYAFNVSYQATPAYLVLDFRGGQDNGRINTEDKKRLRVQQKHSNITTSFNNRDARSSDKGFRESNRGNMQDLRPGAVHFSGVQLNAAQVDRCMEMMKDGPSFIKGVHKTWFGIKFRLEAAFYFKELLFFRLKLLNRAGIPFKVESLRLFIRDNKQAKRTAVQDRELETLAIKSWGLPEQDGSSDTARKGQQIMVALPRFTVADGKQLVIVLREENGDRHLLLKVKGRKLRKTKVFH